MARTKEFDSKKAIEAAMKLFWKEGYKKASIQSLLKVMKLGESSFYNSFKSKKNLYLNCLEHYNQKTTYRRVKALTSDRPIQERVYHFFDVIFADMSAKGAVHGCLMTNSLTFEVMKDKQLKKYVIGEMENFKNFFVQTFDEAIEKRELPQHFDSQMVADIIITHLQGVFKIAMTLDDLTPLKKQTHYFLQNLGFSRHKV